MTLIHTKFKTMHQVSPLAHSYNLLFLSSPPLLYLFHVLAMPLHIRSEPVQRAISTGLILKLETLA